MTDEPPQLLGLAMFACLEQLGGNCVFVDEEDTPSTIRMARVGDVLVVAEFPGDRRLSRRRHVNLFMVEAGSGPFKLEPKHRLASFQAQHFGLPTDWHLQLDQPPALWFKDAMVLLLTALRPALERLRAAAG